MSRRITHCTTSHVFLLAPLLVLQFGCISTQDTTDLRISVMRLSISAAHRLRTEQGTTELMRHCATGDIARVKILLDTKANLNDVNVNGYSALMFAAEEGHLDVVRYLVERGADINMKNGLDHTALFLAASSTGQYLWPLFADHSDNIQQLAIDRMRDEQRQLIDYLIDIGAPVFKSWSSDKDAEATGFAFFHLAEAYERRGNFQTAEESYRVAMDSLPSRLSYSKKTMPEGREYIAGPLNGKYGRRYSLACSHHRVLLASTIKARRKTDSYDS